MRTGWAFLVSGILLIIIGVALLITGWPAADRTTGASPPGSPGPSSGLPLVPGLSPPGTPATPGTPARAEIPSVQVTLRPSSDDIAKHFLDLAFGAGNAHLERWNATDTGRIIISVTANNDADISLLENAVRQFNSMSQTTRVSERIKEGDSGNIAIKFIPETGMDAISVNTSALLTNRELEVNGATAAKITPGTIYINASMKGDVRSHILVRSLFYELGFVGESDMYPDSVFFSGENTNTNLTYADLRAVEIMYGSGLAPGMSLADVKNSVYIR